jgi:hypothetical protein
VTALTQHWSSHGKHARVIGTVRIVTIAAIFGDRRMLPKIRATFFRMTIEAGVVQGLLHKLQIIGCAMIAMTAAAIHLALTYWVRVRLQRLRSLLLMALETDFGLRRGHQNRILSRMARMAICAGDFVDVMIVAVPAKTCVGGVAIHA